MHGIVYVDNDGKAVSPLYTWQDNRGNLILNNNITYAEFLTDYSGYNLSTGYGLVTHFYILPEGAVKLCTINQQGVNSRRYVPGPYSPDEEDEINHLMNFYVNTLAASECQVNAAALPLSHRLGYFAGAVCQATIIPCAPLPQPSNPSPPGASSSRLLSPFSGAAISSPFALGLIACRRSGVPSGAWR